MKVYDGIIAVRTAKCKEIEEKIDRLDDELFSQYMELEYFENKRKELK